MIKLIGVIEDSMFPYSKESLILDLKLHISQKKHSKSDFNSKTLPFFLPHAGCTYRCSFCDQKSIASQSIMPTAEDVEKSISEYTDHLTPDEKIQIGFFGGSFTGLDYEVQHAYLHAAMRHEDHLLGIRISTRPDMLDDKTLELLQKHQVRTVELGAQSLNNQVLRKNLRGHSAEDVIQGVASLKRWGFRVGIQTLPGLPLDTFENTIRTAEEVIQLEPDEVRIYPAVVFKRTLLAKWYLEGSYEPLTLNEAIEWCRCLEDKYETAKIPVIKMGLHASDTISGDEGVVAGPWHPAFRELVDDASMLNRVCIILDRFLADTETAQCHLKLLVPNELWNRVVGHKKENLKRLQALYPALELELKKEKT